MASHQKYKGYISAFGDLDATDFKYGVRVYERVVRGGFHSYTGSWRKVRAFPNGFWDEARARELIRHFVLNVSRWNRETALEKLTVRVLRENQLTTACKYFNSSTIEIVSNCFPEWQAEPWELRSCPNAYWNDLAHCAKACRWVAAKEGFEDNREVFCKKFSARMLKDYGIGRAMVRAGGLYELANMAFPEWNLRPWDLKKIGKITEDIAKKAVRWMVEDELKWTEVEMYENLSVKVFERYGLKSILQHYFGNSPIMAIQGTYPGVYERERFKNAENPFKRN